MKLFAFVGYILAISAVFWLLEASINTLEDKCESEPPGYVEQVKIAILGFIGRPPPEAPWWSPLCQVTSPDLTKNLNALFNYLIFCMVVILCFGSPEIRKPFRWKNCRIRKVVKNVDNERLSGRQGSEITVEQSTDEGPVASQNAVVLKRSSLKKTAQPRPVLLHLFWSLNEVVLKDPVIPDSVKESCLSKSIFGTLKIQPKPLDTLLNNMNRQFQNANNNNTCRTAVDNKLEEINRSSTFSKAEGRYDQVLLGPVAVCLEALSHVVAATFRSYGIENSAIKWSTEMDLSGGPGTIRATSNSMMAEISWSEITIYRVTGVQGLLRSVSYETYLVTYNGLVRTEESTTCMYGQGWNL